MKKSLFFLLIIFCHLSLNGQNKITYIIDNNNFNSFELRAYNGLPILNASDKVALQSYWKMVEMKFLSDEFINLDFDIVGNKPKELIRTKPKGYLSVILSNFLIDLSYVIASDEANTKYGNMWSAESYSNFPKLKKNFQSFTNDNLDYLKKYASKFWEKGYEEAYLVKMIPVKNKFDFSNSGYWTNPVPQKNIFTRKMFRFTSVKHVPKHSFEKDLSDVLFEIPSEKAEKLEAKTSVIFALQKIKIYFLKKDISPETHFGLLGPKMNYGIILQMGYQFESPIIEIFEDVKLTKKIGEVSLKDGLFKN